ncbi:MAG: hypothetical protein ISN28_16130 [Ectothiorhodospiraceae bacterium AqS1]|nr:hypothetical protein [Ectothiorhodospiraceae bacterium AqS1]
MSEEKRIERIEDISVDNRGRIAALEKISENPEKYITEQRGLTWAVVIVVVAALAKYFFSRG